MDALIVTAVVPTFTPGTDLNVLLERLRGQTLPAGERLEVLLLDSSPDGEPVSRLAESFGADYHRVEPGTFSHGRTRNLALTLSEAPFFAFFTQDAFPQDDRVAALLLEAVRSGEDVAGAYARQLPRADASARTCAEVGAWFGNGGRPIVQESIGAAEWGVLDPMARYLRARFDNVASLVGRKTLEEIPFPETYFGEDVEWGVKVLKAGWRLVYEPRAEVIHSHDRGAFYEFRRTVNCHARLARLFELRTVPSLGSAAGGFIRSLGEGFRQTFQTDDDLLKKLTELSALPGREAARALGQYVGGILGAHGWDERWHFGGV